MTTDDPVFVEGSSIFVAVSYLKCSFLMKLKLTVDQRKNSTKQNCRFTGVKYSGSSAPLHSEHLKS